MISQKISRLIEEATFREIRYLIEAPQFDTLKNKNKIDFRDDWYFDEYRIRHIVQKGPNINSDLWQKISTKQSGLVEKKKEKLPPQNIIDLDKKANCRLHVVSKRPVYEGVDLYLEKVQVYKKGKQIKEFITTETESPKDIEELKYLKQVPGIVSVKQVPEKSLRALAKRLI